MIINRSWIVINGSGDIVDKHIVDIKASTDNASKIQVVAPFENTTAITGNVNIVTSKGVDLALILRPKGIKGGDVVNNPDYADWNVWEGTFDERLLSNVSGYTAGKVELTLSIRSDVYNFDGVYKGTFGINKPLPIVADNGDYYILTDIKFNDLRRGNVALRENNQWRYIKGSKVTGGTEKITLAVQPSFYSELPPTDDEYIDGIITDISADVADVRLDLTAHTSDKGNPHYVTADQVDTYTKLVIDSDNAQVLTDAKQYTDDEINTVVGNHNNLKGRVTQNETDILTNKGKISNNEQAITNLGNDKVDKTTTIIGIDLQDDITLGEFKTALGNATQALDGLMSAGDKQRLDTLVSLLENGDSSVVDTIHELLEVFENYPQGADLAQVLEGKVDKVVGYSLSKNDLTDTLKGQYDTAYNHSQIKDGSNPHKLEFSNVLDKPNSIGGYGIIDGVTLTKFEQRISDLLGMANLQDTRITDGVTDTWNNGDIISSDIIMDYNWIYIRVKLSATSKVAYTIMKPAEALDGSKLKLNIENKIYAQFTKTNGNIEFRIVDDAGNPKADLAIMKAWGIKLDGLEIEDINNLETELQPATETKLGRVKAIPKEEKHNKKVAVDDEGNLWYEDLNYTPEIIKVREMGSLNAEITYEGNIQPNLTQVTVGDFVKYSNTFDNVFPFNQIEEVEDLNGNVFIKIPPIYFKFYHSDEGFLRGFDMSPYNEDGGYKLFPIQKGEKDLYIGKYQASETQGKLQSVSGAPIAASRTIETFRNQARAVGEGHFANDFQTWNILQYLLTAYFGTTNSDNYFPDINGDLAETGTMDTLEGKTGYNTLNGKNTFFGIENILKNGYHFIDGLAILDHQVHICDDPINYESNVGANYYAIGNTPTANGYITEHSGGFGNFASANVGGNSATYYADYLYQNSGLRVLYNGSYWTSYAHRGVWSWSGGNAFALAFSYVGSRLIKTLL